MFVSVERAGRRLRDALLPDDAVLSAVTLGELHLGVLRADSALRRESRKTFIGEIERSMEVIQFGREESIVWAELFETLRRSGGVIGERDMIIAATALQHGHRVMTENVREFSRVPGLELLPPPPGT